MMRRLAIILSLAIFTVACNGSTDSDPPPPSPDPTPPPPTIGDWQVMASMPQARTEHWAAAWENKIYVAGGFIDGPELTADFFIYDAVENSWSGGAQIPEERHHAPMVAYDGNVYLIGGYTIPNTPWIQDNTLFIYDIEEDSWSTGQPLPHALGAHAATVTSDGKIHVVGGVRHMGSMIAEDGHFIYDIESDSWSTAPPLPTAREHLGAAYYDGNVYVAAGRNGQNSAMTTFEVYNIESEQWESLPPVPTGRSGIAVTEFDGQIYVFGGESFGAGGNQTYDDAERFDPETESWEAVRPMPTSRHGLGVGVVDEAIYVIGGGPLAGFTYSSVNEKWTP